MTEILTDIGIFLFGYYVSYLVITIFSRPKAGGGENQYNLNGGNSGPGGDSPAPYDSVSFPGPRHPPTKEDPRIIPNELSDASSKDDMELAKNNLVKASLEAYNAYHQLYLESYGENYRQPNKHSELLKRFKDAVEPFD